MSETEELPAGLPAQKRWFFYCMVVFAVLMIAVSLYARLRLLSVPLERDEGGFAYIAQQLLRGVPPFDSGNMKSLSGLIVAYAGILAIFGETATGIHTGLLLINLASTVLMFLLARRLMPLEGAAAATGIFSYLSVSQGVFGVFAHATHFVVFFVLAGLILLLQGVKDRRLVFLFIAGLCFGLAVEMKQHAVFFCLQACLITVGRGWPGGWRSILKRLSWLVIGMLVPYVANCLYMAWHGVFLEFWFWTFTYSLTYATDNTLQGAVINLTQALSVLLKHFAPALFFVPLGLWASFTFKDVDGGNSRFPLYFTIFSCAALTPGLLFYPHYFVMLIPALSLLVGLGFVMLARGIARFSWPAMGWSPYFLMSTALFITGAASIANEREYLFTHTPETVSRKIYGLNPFIESVEIARYIKSHSAPSDRIAVVGSEPQIYFYADRGSATDYLYMYGLCNSHPGVRQMQDEMIREIEEACPEYLVFVAVETSWLYRGEGGRVIDWLQSYLAAYRQVGLVEITATGDSIYTWGKEAEQSRVDENPFIVVYRRNET